VSEREWGRWLTHSQRSKFKGGDSRSLTDLENLNVLLTLTHLTGFWEFFGTLFITDTGCIMQGLRISQEEVDSMREGSSAKSIRLSQNEKAENGENKV
jgi:hypothetical protein